MSWTFLEVARERELQRESERASETERERETSPESRDLNAPEGIRQYIVPPDTLSEVPGTDEVRSPLVSATPA